MRVKYDEESDALYIRLRKSEYYESDEIKEGFILDCDANGNIIGIETLDASAHLAPADLSTVNFEISCQLTKAGKRGWGSSQPCSVRIWARAKQLVEGVILKVRPQSGEAIVLVAEK